LDVWWDGEAVCQAVEIDRLPGNASLILRFLHGGFLHGAYEQSVIGSATMRFDR
jgi:hypothetical protein